MARVKMQKIIEKLDSELRAALKDAVREVMPNTDCDEHALFRAFERAVSRRCRTWERVSDTAVEAGD